MTKEIEVRSVTTALADMAGAVDVQVNSRRLPGEQLIVKFANGYGASAVRSEFSYGGRDGLWEVAVLDEHERLCYDTPVTGDVIGHLEVDGVVDVLRQIAALTTEEVEAHTKARELNEIAEELQGVLNRATAAGVVIGHESAGHYFVWTDESIGADLRADLELDTATGQWKVVKQ